MLFLHRGLSCKGGRKEMEARREGREGEEGERGRGEEGRRGETQQKELNHPDLYLWACFTGRFLNNHPLTFARLRELLSI